MDALSIKELHSTPSRPKAPGVTHACDHDVHTTCAIGVAQHPELVHGSVKFLFQTDEEAMPASFNR